jgi:hypothetical protein
LSKYDKAPRQLSTENADQSVPSSLPASSELALAGSAVSGGVWHSVDLDLGAARRRRIKKRRGLLAQKAFFLLP